MRQTAATTKRRLEKECDGLIQEVARLLFNGRCAFCKKQGHDGHHVVGRANKSLRHEILNILFLCWKHHGVLHGHYTLKEAGGPLPEGIAETDTAERILELFLEQTSGLEKHLEFWRENRYARPGLIWECDLRDKRDELKLLIEELKRGTNEK